MVKFIYGTRRRKSKSSNKKAKDSSSDFGGNTYSALKDEREDKLLDEAFCTEMQTDHSLVNLNTPSSKKKKRTKEYLSLNDGKGSLKDAKGQKNNNDNRSRFFTHKYVAKPSSRMQHIFSGDKAIKADGETWIERVVIIERNVSQTYFIACGRGAVASVIRLGWVGRNRVQGVDLLMSRPTRLRLTKWFSFSRPNVCRVTQ
jgi:hypothetical protein